MVEPISRLKLVAGLGNPGFEYAMTPHNLGFMAADRIAEAWGAKISRPESRSLTTRVRIDGIEVILAKPQTFMNLSGLAVGRLLDKYDVEVKDLIVLVDDADLPFGTLRIRERGSAGGHNGLKSVIGVTQSDRFARVRMGVKPEHPLEDRAAHVLGRFRKADFETLAAMVDRAAEAVELILRQGIQAAMNRYNRRDAP